MYPSVYIVILNWNGWNDTIECIESLKDLSYPNYKIIIVDNASTNDSVYQIKNIFPNIKIIESSENGGFARGNNLGIKFALSECADYIWLLNNDTTVSSLSLSEMIKLAEVDNNIGIVGSVLYEYYHPNMIQAWGGGKFHPFLATTSHYKSEKLEVDHIIGASMLIKQEVFNDVGLLDERFFFFMEDTEYSIRARKHGWSLAVAKNSRVYHKGGSSLKDNQIKGKSLKSDQLYISAVGTYMGISKVKIVPVTIRFLAIIFQRFTRKQYKRIKPLSMAYWGNYFKYIK